MLTQENDEINSQDSSNFLFPSLPFSPLFSFPLSFLFPSLFFSPLFSFSLSFLSHSLFFSTLFSFPLSFIFHSLFFSHLFSYPLIRLEVPILEPFSSFLQLEYRPYSPSHTHILFYLILPENQWVIQSLQILIAIGEQNSFREIEVSYDLKL